MIRISTTHGGGLRTYYPGEIYTLTAQVKTPLYLYLYDIYPDGKKVEPLYPRDGETEILLSLESSTKYRKRLKNGVKGLR